MIGAEDTSWGPGLSYTVLITVYRQDYNERLQLKEVQLLRIERESERGGAQLQREIIS
jgi:hypothetical protein